MNSIPCPWKDAPRYCPDVSFPPYRFLPGKNPHPVIDPRGHSYGKTPPVFPILSPERWRENRDYLFGVDLYHQGFLWESHEVWEGLWKPLSKEDPQAQYYQGLIQNSAAVLKRRLGEKRGAERLSRESFRRIEFVLASLSKESKGFFMGLELRKFLDEMRESPPPHIRLIL